MSASYSCTLHGGGLALALAIRGQRTPAEDARLRDEALALGVEHLRALARSNQIEALVGTGLRTAGVELGDAWSEQVAGNASRVESLIAAIETVTSRLEGAALPSAAIEAGGVLLGTGLPAAGYCPSDIDLLVGSDRWDEVLRVFRSEGFEPAHRRETTTHRVEFRRDVGDIREWIEVGFAPFFRRWVPLSLVDLSQEWLERRVRSPRSSAWVLDPTDALTFVCLHTSLHSFVRAPGLRLHVDVDRLVRDCSIDWDRLVVQAKRTKAPTRVFVSLAMASELLGSPIPVDVLDQLQPSPARWDAIRCLLQGREIAGTGRRGLGRLETVLLDARVDDSGRSAWIRRVFWPDTSWLEARFGDGKSRSTAWLQARRYAALATSWRPR